MDIRSFQPIERAEIGTTVNRPVLVLSVTDVYKNGKQSYVKISMRDGFSEFTVNMFKTSKAELADKGVIKYAVCDVFIDVTDYKGSKSMLVQDIFPTKAEGISADDFVKLPPVDRELMFNEITDILNSAADDMNGEYAPLSALAVKLLSDNKESFMSSSAAVSVHHNFLGGLIYHTYRMVKAADKISDVYTNLDRELLVSAAAIHDIGKLWEYETHRLGDADYTPTGILFGHAFMGASLVKSKGGEKPYHPEKVKLLRHMILSHHGALEWGAVVLPAIPEAFALHYIDNLDAKLNIVETAYETMDNGTVSANKPFGLDGRVYKPKY